MPVPDEIRPRRKKSNSIAECGPHPIDVHIGSRMRLRRTFLGLSQVQLGQALGLSFQQIQKYEHGLNRLCPSRLVELGEILEVPVSFFFDDLPPEVVEALPPPAFGDRALVPDLEMPDRQARQDIQDIVAAYGRIPDPLVRRRLFELTRLVADAANAPAAGDDPDSSAASPREKRRRGRPRFRD